MRQILPGILVTGAVAFILLQFIRPAIPDAPASAEIRLPASVKAVLQKDCYGCHSNQRRLAWFDQVQPAYWLARKDTLDGRARLNFSTIGSQPEAAQKGALYESIAMMQLGSMPLPRYLALHPEAKVSAQDLQTIEDYLSPWSSPIPHATADNSTPSAPAVANSSAIKPAPNGIPYDPEWRNWKLLSVTDRGDNRQFRLILGNDIAVRAAREGNVHPWPNGTRFAKLAWLQQRAPDGLVTPGNFWQIEMMIKDATRFRTTDGWGWARWRGVDLKPYGQDAAFVNECTGCHLPVRGNDYVYTEPLSPASISGQEVLNNAADSFPKGLSINPLDWTPVTMYSDPQRHTICVLFVDPRDTKPATTLADSHTALVTWTERDDPHWFGARIPDKVLSVEMVRPGAHQETEYHSFPGEPVDSPGANTTTAARSRLITSLEAAQVPQFAIRSATQPSDRPRPRAVPEATPKLLSPVQSRLLRR